MTKSSVKGGSAESYHARKVAFLEKEEGTDKEVLFYKVRLSTVTRVRNQQWGERRLQRLVHKDKAATVSEEQ